MAFDLRDLLIQAFQSQASDVHLHACSPPVFRIHGELKPMGSVSLGESDTEQMAKSIIPEKLWDSFLEEGELDFNYELEKVSRFRVNAFLQKGRISLAIRLIPIKIPTLEELKLPPVLEQMLTYPQGLILVTGPTGSGKTTTLAAMIHYINQHYAKHIITLEDPIEYVHSQQKSIINQREVGIDTKSFAAGLRSALRQDPDIILVGEMRDLETIATAITAAETGHLVLATLHTIGAAETINRIIDVFPPHQQQQIRIQVAETLRGIISQRLFPTMNGDGRIAATEVLVNIPSVANLIRNEKVHQIQNILQTNRHKGMHTLEMSILNLLERNIISYDVAKPYLPAGEY